MIDQKLKHKFKIRIGYWLSLNSKTNGIGLPQKSLGSDLTYLTYFVSTRTFQILKKLLIMSYVRFTLGFVPIGYFEY